MLEQQEFSIPQSLFELAVELEIPDVVTDSENFSKTRSAGTKPSVWAEMKKAGKTK